MAEEHVIRVKDLLERLKALPPETEIWSLTQCYEGPVKSFEELGFFIWRSSDRGLVLVLDDRSAYHPGITAREIPLDYWEC